MKSMTDDLQNKLKKQRDQTAIDEIENYKTKSVVDEMFPDDFESTINFILTHQDKLGVSKVGIYWSVYKHLFKKIRFVDYVIVEWTDGKVTKFSMDDDCGDYCFEVRLTNELVSTIEKYGGILTDTGDVY